MKINKDGLIEECSIPFRIDLIPKSNKTSRPQKYMNPKTITIHNTGNPNADAEDNSEYVDNATGYVSWHFTIGKNIVFQELPIYEHAWHAGDGSNGEGNLTSIGIEVSEEDGAYETAIKFVAELLLWFGWDVSYLRKHQDWSGKYCPRLIIPIWDTDFIPKIEEEMREDSMSERIALQFISDGRVIEDLEKDTIDKLSGRLSLYKVHIPEAKLYEYCGRDLKYGDWKSTDYDDVLAYQKAINIIRTHDGMSSVGEDGMFGNEGKNSCISFQTKYGLGVSGEVTEATANKMNEVLIEIKEVKEAKENEQDEEDSNNSVEPKNNLNPPTVTLQYGSKGKDVLNMQICYKMIGKELSLDGSYGNESRTITNQVRAKYGLEQNGEYNSQIAELLKQETVTDKTITYVYNGVYYTEVDKSQMKGIRKNATGRQMRNHLDDKYGFINASFIWYYQGKSYPLSPLKAEGVTLENRTTLNYNESTGWLGSPMNIFCIYDDGTVGVELTNNVKARKDIVFAVGGVKCSPSISWEGFRIENKKAIDYDTTRHSISYNPVSDRIVIAFTYSKTIYDFADRVEATGKIHIVGLDSGKSTQGDTGLKERYTDREMVLWMYWLK